MGFFKLGASLTLEFEDSFYIFQGFLFFGFFFKCFRPFDVCFFVRNKNELWVFLILRNCLLGQCLLKVRVRRSFWIYFFCLIAVLGSIAWFSVYYREKRERFEDQVIVGSWFLYAILSYSFERKRERQREKEVWRRSYSGLLSGYKGTRFWVSET